MKEKSNGTIEDGRRRYSRPVDLYAAAKSRRQDDDEGERVTVPRSHSGKTTIQSSDSFLILRFTRLFFRVSFFARCEMLFFIFFFIAVG